MSTYKKFLASYGPVGQLPTEEKLFTSPFTSWSWLAIARELQEDKAGQADHAPDCQWNAAMDYSDTVAELAEQALTNKGGRIEGNTPGHCGDYDCRMRYTVLEVI